MRASPMFSTSTTRLSIARLATTLFRWSWDSSHYVPLMLPCHLQLRMKIRLISSLKHIRQTTSLNTSNIFSSRPTTFWRNQILSTSNDMINMINSCCISKRNDLPEPIGKPEHSDMVLTPLPTPWETMHLSSTFPHPLAYT